MFGVDVEADVPDAAGGGLYVGDGSSWARMRGASKTKVRARMLAERGWDRDLHRQRRLPKSLYYKAMRDEVIKCMKNDDLFYLLVKGRARKVDRARPKWRRCAVTLSGRQGGCACKDA